MAVLEGRGVEGEEKKNGSVRGGGGVEGEEKKNDSVRREGGRGRGKEEWQC